LLSAVLTAVGLRYPLGGNAGRCHDGSCVSGGARFRTRHNLTHTLAFYRKDMATVPVLNVGFYNFVATQQIVALVSSDSAPMRRLVKDLRSSGNLIDATQGRRTKSVIFTLGPHIVLSAVSQETLARRLMSGEEVGGDEE
jgi:regulator of extracellular matrix RemA (YlzA/DUF370 family)